jgi:type VI secretion system protein ImpM
LSRNLQRDFIDSWDTWLGSAMAASKEHLGDSWLNHYLTSPLWRFALAPGLCGRYNCFGIMMPSVDRVGRYFPLTLVQPYEPEVDLITATTAIGDWYTAIEDLALSALDDHLSVDDFTASLSEISLPDLTAHHKTELPEPVMQQGLYRSNLTDIDHITQAVNQFNRTQLKLLFPGTTIWSTAGAETIPPMLLINDGLPKADKFSALLTGQWDSSADSAQSDLVSSNSEDIS